MDSFRMLSGGMILILATMVLTAPVQARTKLVALPDREATSIRFDNPNATLVEEERILTLQEGENMVDFSWRGVQIDPDSIKLSILSHPGKVTLLSVSYPPGEAALVWRIHSEEAWEERVRISYLLSYIDRLITYKGIATQDERTLDLDAFLVLRNFSGEDFENAEVILGQGDPFSGKISHEETRQIHFMSVEGIPIKKTFTWDSAERPWEPKRLNRDVGIPVHYVIENDRESGLGKTHLWGGKIRVFQDDGHDSTIFLGEDRSKLVPVGEPLKIYIGDSRDISVTQHKIKDVKINRRPSKYKIVLYDTDEMIRTKVENFKDEMLTVDLIQHIPGQWDMVESSVPYEKRDSSILVFSVDVPAKGSKELTFHYRRRNIRN
ncbi:hypothetical protein EP232_05715 [bacterium]|nr:MAG: hypothetical protein EP232_05715 [bacterium]